MNSFYAEYKGLFTFYIEQEDEMERQKMFRKEHPNPEQPNTVTNKRRRGKKRLQASTTKIVAISEHDHFNKPIAITSPTSKLRQPSVELRKHEEFSVQYDKPYIFHRRKDRLKTNHLRSMEYKVVEQRPGVVPEMLPISEDSQTLTKQNLSAKKLRALERYKGVFNRKCFLPMIGSGRLHPSHSRDHSPYSNAKTNTQQQAMEFVFSLLNVYSSRLNPSRNLSSIELKRKPNEQVLSFIELPKKDDPYRYIARWQQMRKEVAKRYNFPL